MDQQVTNLTRFDVYFPERRNFFSRMQTYSANLAIPNRPYFFPVELVWMTKGDQSQYWEGATHWQCRRLLAIRHAVYANKETAGQAGQNILLFTLHKNYLKILGKGLLTNRQWNGRQEFSNIDYGRNASLKPYTRMEKALS
ncbi:MAG: hypothetical protein IPK94_05010 [Saprospiraceae bacterium]|nr:hypothetical protein [Saprospiraceae bacterium]